VVGGTRAVSLLVFVFVPSFRGSGLLGIGDSLEVVANILDLDTYKR